MKTNSLEKIKRLRSLNEIITRGGQAISVYREQRGGGQLPSDEEFVRLIDERRFAGVPIIAETLWQRFYKNSADHFFPAFQNADDHALKFAEVFGDDACRSIIVSAENVVDGRIDLLGMKGIYVGTDVDWHREPVSSKRSPLKHWKEFDDLDSTETGNKKTIWELNRHQHFFHLGAAYWLTGDESYAKCFASHLSSWMEQNPPGMGINWASSLEVSFRAMSWIWAFNFFQNSEHFTPELFREAVKHLYCHGRHIEQYLSKYYSPNTHLTGEGLGLYYLGTQLPFLDRAEHWRKLGEDILFSEITKQIHSDGVYFEQSSWYQKYTADFYLHFVLLRTMFGDPYYNAPSAEVENRLQAMLSHMMHLTQPNGRTPIIGDDDGGRALPMTTAAPDDHRGSLAVGAVIFGDGNLKYAAGGVSQELYWLLGNDGIAAYNSIRSVEPSETSVGYENGGYFVMRDGWSETDNYLTVDCGELGSLAAGHGHADVLGIEVAAHGRPLLIDSGTYTYHESRELRDYFRSSMAHNTLVIDRVSSSVPGNIFNWKARANAKLNNWIAAERFDFFSGSHDGYERLNEPAIHTRSILFAKGDYWIIRDLVETAGEHEYSLNFHFDHEVNTAISDAGEWVGGNDHRLYTFGDNGEWQQKESWVSKEHGNKVNAPFMRFISKGAGPQEFFSFILPIAPGENAPVVTEAAMAGGRAFVINYRDYTDLFILNDSPGEVIDNGVFESDFEYTWARMSSGENLPDEIIVINGSSLMLEGNTVFGSAIEHASVMRLGRDLYVKTNAGRSSAQLGVVERRKGERRQSGNDRRQADSK